MFDAGYEICLSLQEPKEWSVANFLFFPLGLMIGTLGTLIGAGGGFILVPILIFMYPRFTTQQITAISMLCVACNAGSGSMAYLYRRQVHVKTALIFTLASIPGAWLGSSLTRKMERGSFELYFAALLLSLGLFIFFRKPKERNVSETNGHWVPASRDYALGFAISLAVGFLASVLGIGGGIVHVPLMAHALEMPVHLAAGTSHLILAITALVATAEHLLHGDISSAMSFLPYLALGMLAGAQLGAFLSKRVSSVIIMKALAVAIVLVGIRLLWGHSQHHPEATPVTNLQHAVQY
jgi:uncharacterized membrane protein YfcA